MPCDYKKYPENWKEIRQRILERDGHKCKFCGIANYAKGYRSEDNGEFVVAECTHNSVINESGYAVRAIKIVLTIAHLHDPNPMNCEDENLAALCQKCHNRHDQPMRQANAKKTRKAKKQAAIGQIELF